LEKIIGLLLRYSKSGGKCRIETNFTQLAVKAYDVEHTLQALKIQIYYKGDHKIVIPRKLVQQQEKSRAKQKHIINPERI
jgi:histone acetyltransferase HTATIP